MKRKIIRKRLTTVIQSLLQIVSIALPSTLIRILPSESFWTKSLCHLSRTTIRPSPGRATSDIFSSLEFFSNFAQKWANMPIYILVEMTQGVREQCPTNIHLKPTFIA